MITLEVLIGAVIRNIRNMIYYTKKIHDIIKDIPENFQEWEKLKKEINKILNNRTIPSNNKVKLITRDRLIQVRYGGQKSRSIKKGWNDPSYTLEELKDWCFSQDLFHELYDDWIKSGFDKKLSPSFDRKNDYEGYTLDNLKLMTWDENNKKGNLNRKGGLNNKQSKFVVQFDKNGNFINEYHSMMEAERKTSVSSRGIWVSCNSEYKTAGKFKWEYKNTINYD